jgi:murein hydrolase activator
MRFTLLLLLLFSVIEISAASANSLEENRRALEQIEKRMKDAAKGVGQKQKAARTLEKDLEVVERETARIRSRIAALENEASQLSKDMSDKNREIATLQETISRSEVDVRQRLVALYKSGGGGTLRLLFAETSPAKAAETYDFLGRIVRRDRELLRDYRRQLESLESARRELVQMQERHRSSLAALKQEQDSLRRTTELKKQLLAQTRKDEGALSAELNELRERSKRLSAMIQELESAKARQYTQKSSSGGPFARQKGRLPWPSSGTVRVGFGTSRNRQLGTLQESQGIEIQTGANETISAVYNGRVLYANWFRGFGNLLILDHGDGYYSLYAQAARLTRKVGDQVKGGDVLAFSGDDGVYFEIRHHGAPLNPAVWLIPR